MEVERDGQTVATVKKAMITPLRERFAIALESRTVAAYQQAVGAGKEAQQAAAEVTIRCERRLQEELR